MRLTTLCAINALRPVLSYPAAAPAPSPPPTLSGWGAGQTPPGTIYYVNQAAANDSGTGAVGSPKKYISSAMALCSPGDGVMIEDGTYSNALDTIDGVAGRGSAGNYVYVCARNWGSVTLTRPPLFAKSVNHYKQFAGLRIDAGTASKGASGSFLRFFFCGFGHGPLSDNEVNWGVGDGTVTPGAYMHLYEDCYCYGPGGRYVFLVYNSDSIVVRRLFIRHEKGWSDTKGDPQGGFANYNSTNTLWQNCLALDIQDDTNMGANFYNPSNSRASDNVKQQGCIFGFRGAGTPTVGIAWDDSATCPNQNVTDLVTFGLSQPGNANGGAKTVTVNRWTSIGDGVNWRRYGGGSLTLSNGSAWNFTGDPSNTGGDTFAAAPNLNNYYPTVISGCTNLNPATGTQIKFPVRHEAGALKTAGRGAEVLYKIGVSGSMYGDAGVETLTSDKLWPWANEAQILADVRTDAIARRGFAADGATQMNGSPQTISAYVIEAAGTAMANLVY